MGRQPGEGWAHDPLERRGAESSQTVIPSGHPRRLLPAGTPKTSIQQSLPSLLSSLEGGLFCLSRPRDLGEGEESGVVGSRERERGIGLQPDLL